MKVTKFVSSFLSAADLREMGPQLVLIESCEEEEVGGQAKPVLRGDDPKHVFVLNRTNIESIVEALGSDDTDEWCDEIVVAFYDPSVTFNNKKIGGIRFRRAKPGTPKPAKRERKGVQIADKDIPF